MSAGATRRTSRATSRTTRAGGGGPRGGGSMMGLLGAIVVVVLLLGGMAIYLKMEGDRKAAEANRTVGVVAAAVDLPAGHQIVQQDLTIKQVHPNSVESGSFNDVGDPSLVGGVLAVAVSSNQTITRNLLGTGQVEEKLMPEPGESTVAVVLKGSDAVQPFLQKSKIVSVFRVFNTASGNRIMKSLSKRARILDVKKSDSALENAQKGGTETLVTLALSPNDAQQVNTYKDEAVLVDGPDQEPPPSNVTLLTYWRGIESEDMEVTPEVGASKMVAKEEGEKK